MNLPSNSKILNMKTIISTLLLDSLVACSIGEQKYDCEGIGLVITTKESKFGNNGSLKYCKTEGVVNYYGVGNCNNLDKVNYQFDTVTYLMTAVHSQGGTLQCKKVN